MVAEVVVDVTYEELVANNLELEDGMIYAALGASGFAVISAETREFEIISAPIGTSGVHDLAVAGGFLFTLDASGVGDLTVYDLTTPMDPELVSGPVTVRVGPFAGVSAAGGRVCVSGGTGLLTVRSYTDLGVISTSSSTIDLGIGQPDVLLAADGETAYVSTDFSGLVSGAGFGITLLELDDPPGALTSLAQIGLAGAGFTGGFSFPANFPIESALLPDGDFVTAHGGGLSVIDPVAESVLGELDLSFDAVNVDTDGSTAFVVGTSRSIAEVDISDPDDPLLVSSESSAGSSAYLSVAVDAGTIALAPAGSPLEVLTRE